VLDGVILSVGLFVQIGCKFFQNVSGHVDSELNPEFGRGI
jgi:hypothetical protein